ncbi:MAG: FG-GAP-like repeat-containing protein [Candidatus Zixiibacteriota bacterium]
MRSRVVASVVVLAVLAMFVTPVDGERVSLNQVEPHRSVGAALQHEICFEPTVSYPAGSYAEDVVPSDLDGDGDVDLVAVFYSIHEENLLVCMNNGDGTLQAPVYYRIPFSVVRAVVVSDLDGDGDPDLAAAVIDNDWVSVLTNNGDGTFAPPANYAAGDGPISLDAADLDGDGDTDLAVANIYSHRVAVLKNNGDATFAAPVTYPGMNQPYAVITADLDGDDDADLAVANTDRDDVSILKNNGDGSFMAAVNFAAGDGPFWIASADFDLDADSDLAVVDLLSDNVSILENNGDGSFQAPAGYAVGDLPRWVTVADFDGDGDPDLAVANSNNDNVSVLGNDGSGTFASAGNFPVGDAPYSMCAADLNGDDAPDLATANFNGGIVSVLLNCGNACIPPPADLALWLPFDEGTPGPSKNLAAPYDGIQGGALNPVPGEVDGALRFDGVGTHVDVASYPGIFDANDPGTGDLTIDAWVMRETGDNGVRTVVDKRVSLGGGQYRGFSLYIYDGRLGCQLADGGYTGWNTAPAEIVPATGWHHVAVTIDRDQTDGGRFYLDGVLLGTPFNPTGRSGSLSNSAPLRVGGISFALSNLFLGSIDEVEFFGRCLSEVEIVDIYQARSFGKCKCDCPWQCDFEPNGFIDAVDLAVEIDVVFFGGADRQDPACPATRGDFNADGFTDSVDLALLIDHVFFGGTGPVDPCAL